MKFLTAEFSAPENVRQMRCPPLIITGQSQNTLAIEAALKTELRKIPQVQLQLLICYISRGCFACVAAGGGHI